MDGGARALKRYEAHREYQFLTLSVLLHKEGCPPRVDRVYQANVDSEETRARKRGHGKSHVHPMTVR